MSTHNTHFSVQTVKWQHTTHISLFRQSNVNTQHTFLCSDSQMSTHNTHFSVQTVKCQHTTHISLFRQSNVNTQHKFLPSDSQMSTHKTNSILRFCGAKEQQMK